MGRNKPSIKLVGFENILKPFYSQQLSIVELSILNIQLWDNSCGVRRHRDTHVTVEDIKYLDMWNWEGKKRNIKKHFSG